MKRLAYFILILSLLSLSCRAVTSWLSPAADPTVSPPTDPSAVPPTSSSSPQLTDIRERLEALGGSPCAGLSGFTCVTLTVPLDHFDPANSETIEVVFAVAPATGDRKGMFVQAFPGGPGGEGISYASRDYYPMQVQEQYDIVFFDQRGLGLSSPLECKDTYANYLLQYLNGQDDIGEEGYDTPEEQEAAIQNASSFVDQCVAEIGLDPDKLKFFNTDQVAEDIELFRQAIGDEKFMLYGVSYGTSVAQTYARAHADHLSGLILDGTQNTTLSGDEIAFSQWEAFNAVLSEVFEACDADPECSSLLDGNAQAAYDELAGKLAEAPIVYESSSREHRFTLHMLDFTTAYQLYGIDSRMDLMRALAAARDGDILPMANLFFGVSNIDPATGQYVGDENFSDTMYYIVWCSDDAYYSGTPEERAARLIEEGQKLNGLVPRIDLDVLSLGLTCPFWPGAPGSPEEHQPLRAEGVPTFVLNATLDPATPFHEGKAVFENLDDGYHLYVEGGLHGSYGWGYSCPDDYVNDFLVNGTLPDQREIVCDWGDAVLGQ